MSPPTAFIFTVATNTRDGTGRDGTGLATKTRDGTGLATKTRDGTAKHARGKGGGGGGGGGGGTRFLLKKVVKWMVTVAVWLQISTVQARSQRFPLGGSDFKTQ